MGPGGDLTRLVVAVVVAVVAVVVVVVCVLCSLEPLERKESLSRRCASPLAPRRAPHRVPGAAHRTANSCQGSAPRAHLSSPTSGASHAWASAWPSVCAVTVSCAPCRWARAHRPQVETLSSAALSAASNGLGTSGLALRSFCSSPAYARSLRSSRKSEQALTAAATAWLGSLMGLRSWPVSSGPASVGCTS